MILQFSTKSKIGLNCIYILHLAVSFKIASMWNQGCLFESVLKYYEIKLTKFKHCDKVFMSKRGREAWKNMGHRVKSWGFFTLVFFESFSSHYDELLTWLLLSALFGPTWLESRGLVKKSESYIFFPLVNIRHCMRL